MPQHVCVVIAKPGEPPLASSMEDIPGAIRNLVGGPIDGLRIASYPDRHLYAYVHDEGILLHLPENRAVRGRVLHGTIVVVAVDLNGETVTMDERHMYDAFALLGGP